MIGLAAYGEVLWNGAGFSHPDDWHAASMDVTEFRPLLGVSYAVNRAIGGWMAVNLAGHLLAAGLLLKLTGNFMGAALFAVHPLGVDAVASVAGRSSVLCGVFVLAALVAVRWRRPAWFVLAAISAFASKEEAVILFILAPLMLWFIGERRNAILAAVAGMVTAGVLVFVWSGHLDRAARPPTLIAAGIESALPLREHVHQFASAVGGYVLPKMIAPVGLSADPEISYSLFSEIVGWASLPILLPLAPYILAPLPDVFLEHRAYLAIAGVTALLAIWLRRWPIAWLLMLAVFVILTHERARVYASPVGLWEDAVSKAPLKARPLNNLGQIYAIAERWDESEIMLRRAIHAAPQIRTGWSNLTALYLRRGDLANASHVLDAHTAYLKGVANVR